MTGTLDDWRSRATLTVPEAAVVLRMGKNTAYDAARTGDLPVVRFGTRLVVPVARLRALLGETDADADQ